MGFAGNAGSSRRSHYLPKNSFNNNKSGLRRFQKNILDTVSSRPKTIDSDVIEQIDCIDKLCDEGDCMWLSSDSTTPSLLSSDDSQDIWELDCLELTLHDTVIPPNEASLFLNKLCADADEKPLQEHVTQPQEIVGYEAKDPSVNCLESGSYSSFGWPHCESSPVCSNPGTPLSAYTGTSSEFDKSDIWVSSLDLGMEDFSLSNEKEPGIDIFGSNIPSTSTSLESHQIRLSVSSSAISVDEEDDIKVPVKDHDSGEPLFWPFDYKSYACLDFEEFLCLSPPKERNIDNSELHVSMSFKKTSQSTRKNIQEPKRIVTLSSASKSATCEGERIGLHHGAQGTATTSAGLSQSSNDPHNQSISKRKPPKLNIHVSRYQNSSTDYLIQSECLELYNSVVEGVSIEKVVGLTEFIGQEGINVDISGHLDPCGFPLHEFNAT